MKLQGPLYFSAFMLMLFSFIHVHGSNKGNESYGKGNYYTTEGDESYGKGKYYTTKGNEKGNYYTTKGNESYGKGDNYYTTTGNESYGKGDYYETSSSNVGGKGDNLYHAKGKSGKGEYWNAQGDFDNGWIYGKGKGYGFKGKGYGLKGNGYGLKGNGYGLKGNGYGLKGNGYEWGQQEQKGKGYYDHSNSKGSKSYKGANPSVAMYDEWGEILYPDEWEVITPYNYEKASFVNSEQEKGSFLMPKKNDGPVVKLTLRDPRWNEYVNKGLNVKPKCKFCNSPPALGIYPGNGQPYDTCCRTCALSEGERCSCVIPGQITELCVHCKKPEHGLCCN